MHIWRGYRLWFKSYDSTLTIYRRWFIACYSPFRFHNLRFIENHNYGHLIRWSKWSKYDLQSAAITDHLIQKGNRSICMTMCRHQMDMILKSIRANRQSDLSAILAECLKSCQLKSSNFEVGKRLRDRRLPIVRGLQANRVERTTRYLTGDLQL